jgi:hypothetical protein
MQSITGNVPANDLQNQNTFNGPLFDPSNPAIFNFDLEGLQFGNHYGALEFGMLNHMSSGAAETPAHDNLRSMSQHGGSDASFSTAGLYNNGLTQYGMYPQQDTTTLSDYVGIDSNPANLFDLQRHQILPRAYAIETSSQSFASPSTDPQQSPQPFDSSPQATTVSYPTNVAFNKPLPNQGTHPHYSKRHDAKGTAFDSKSFPSQPVRNRDPADIYTNVTEPYSYTEGFHNFTAYLVRNFSRSVTLKIAKSLASIRPSFISCTKTLGPSDLIFMEKCFQRTLFEYEGFMGQSCTPTIVCRRTGEVAAVNKEFTLLTGWKKDVLLGAEANLNINTGNTSTSNSRNPSGPPSQGNSGRAGLTTPRMRQTDVTKGKSGRPQPVFLAELMDDNSVVDFYEDFSKLAFGDSRGSVQKLCKLVKYQTKDGLEVETKNEGKSSERMKKEKGSSAGMLLGGRVSKIDGENGIQRLERDGKMDCAYCWSIRTDTFGIPMLIVLNVRARPIPFFCHLACGM